MGKFCSSNTIVFFCDICCQKLSCPGFNLFMLNCRDCYIIFQGKNIFFTLIFVCSQSIIRVKIPMLIASGILVICVGRPCIYDQFVPCGSSARILVSYLILTSASKTNRLSKNNYFMYYELMIAISFSFCSLVKSKTVRVNLSIVAVGTWLLKFGLFIYSCFSMTFVFHVFLQDGVQ